MRTTLTLDADVAAMLEKLQREREMGLKELVNDALRQALPKMGEPPRPRRRFRTEAVSLGRCLVPSLDDVTAAVALAEGEGFR
jgi:Ribbon-helix-helix protein, copG family